jgi:hypothetical protein
MKRTIPSSQRRGLVYPVVRPLPHPSASALGQPGIW